MRYLKNWAEAQQTVEAREHSFLRVDDGDPIAWNAVDAKNDDFWGFDPEVDYVLCTLEDRETALDALYGWFHDGEERPGSRA